MVHVQAVVTPSLTVGHYVLWMLPLTVLLAWLTGRLLGVRRRLPPGGARGRRWSRPAGAASRNPFAALTDSGTAAPGNGLPHPTSLHTIARVTCDN